MSISTVTQATSKSTAVTLDKTTGKITMHAASLTAAAEVSFTLTNARIKASDVVVVNHSSAGTAGAYAVHANLIADGSCKITVGNMSAGDLAEAIVLSYRVLHYVG